MDQANGDQILLRKRLQVTITDLGREMTPFLSDRGLSFDRRRLVYLPRVSTVSLDSATVKPSLPFGFSLSTPWWK